MRIAEHRQPVGPKRKRRLKRRCERVDGLERQPVHQIEIDRRHAGRAQAGDGARNHLGRLNTPDRGLDGGIEGLYAQADASNAIAGERGGPVPLEAARIDLHRHDWIVEPEGLRQVAHQCLEI